MSRIYPGWHVVVLAMLINMIISGFTVSSFSLYVIPISREFLLSRADANTALILINVGTACVAPFLGRLIDRFPIRWTMVSCSAILGVSLILLSLSRSLPLSILVLLVAVPAGYLGAGSLTNTVLIARWFQAQRGRAMALATLGMSLSTVGIVPLVGWAIQAEGWRQALAISGAASLVVLLPMGFLVRERPRPGETESIVKTSAAPDLPETDGSRPAHVLAILRSGEFWCICLGTALALAIAQTLVVTMVPLAIERGLTMIQASTLISATGIGALAGALLLIALADRFNRTILLAGLYLAIAFLNFALLHSATYGILMVVAVAKGVATGCVLPLFYALLADRFGAASFGTVRGLSMPILAAVSMLFLRFAGEAFDRSGSYALTFQVFTVAGLGAACMMIAASRFARGSVPTVEVAS